MFAPLDVKVAVPPTQIADEDVVAVKVGIALTVKFIVLVLEHPDALVAVTVYIVVAVGVTATDAPINAPGFQV